MAELELKPDLQVPRLVCHAVRPRPPSVSLPSSLPPFSFLPFCSFLLYVLWKNNMHTEKYTTNRSAELSKSSQSERAVHPASDEATMPFQHSEAPLWAPLAPAPQELPLSRLLTQEATFAFLKTSYKWKIHSAAFCICCLVCGILSQIRPWCGVGPWRAHSVPWSSHPFSCGWTTEWFPVWGPLAVKPNMLIYGY